MPTRLESPPAPSSPPAPKATTPTARGEAIRVAVTFSQPVVVAGEPCLRLTIGGKKRWAKYARSGKKGARLIFSCKVKSTDTDDDGVSIKKNQLKLSGGAIEDAKGNRTRLRHPALPD